MIFFILIIALFIVSISISNPYDPGFSRMSYTSDRIYFCEELNSSFLDFNNIDSSYRIMTVNLEGYDTKYLNVKFTPNGLDFLEVDKYGMSLEESNTMTSSDVNYDLDKVTFDFNVVEDMIFGDKFRGQRLHFTGRKIKEEDLKDHSSRYSTYYTDGKNDLIYRFNYATLRLRETPVSESDNEIKNTDNEETNNKKQIDYTYCYLYYNNDRTFKAYADLKYRTFPDTKIYLFSGNFNEDVDDVKFTITEKDENNFKLDIDSFELTFKRRVSRRYYYESDSDSWFDSL